MNYKPDQVCDCGCECDCCDCGCCCETGCVTSWVGRKAPCFLAPAVLDGGRIDESFSLKPYLGHKYVILFFYPKDFTFVCPTELHAFQGALAEFEKRNTQVVACSTDSVETHCAWLQQPKSQGGVQGVTYPMVSDVNKTISARYGVLSGGYCIRSGVLKAFHYDVNGDRKEGGTLVAYRGLFLIDKNGIVQHQVVNNMPLGRSVQETLRMIDALQHVEQFGEVCPIDWDKGNAGIKPDIDGLHRYFS